MSKTSIELVTKPRKKRAPSTAFKENNPHRFKAGEGSPNPGGKPKEDRLISKVLRVQLNVRAPDAIAKAVGAPRGASWAQCIGFSLMQSAVRGDAAAARLLIETVEGKAPTILTGMDGEPLFNGSASERPLIHVNFIESDGDGAPKVINGAH
jgi:hypothetical protein